MSGAEKASFGEKCNVFRREFQLKEVKLMLLEVASRALMSVSKMKGADFFIRQAFENFGA